MKEYILKLLLKCFARSESYDLEKLGGILADYGDHYEIYFQDSGLSVYCGQRIIDVKSTKKLGTEIAI